MDIKKFAIDKKSEAEGVWVKLDENTEVKVARMNNARYNKLFRRLSQPYKKAIRTNTLSDSVAEDILYRCAAETILLDWEGLEEDGKPIEYSTDKAYELLKNYEQFRDFVMGCAEDFDLFKVQDAEETEKN